MRETESLLYISTIETNATSKLVAMDSKLDQMERLLDELEQRVGIFGIRTCHDVSYAETTRH